MCANVCRPEDVCVGGRMTRKQMGFRMCRCDTQTFPEPPAIRERTGIESRLSDPATILAIF